MNGGSEGVLLPLCWINVINRLFMAGLTLQRLPVCGLQSSCQKTLEYHLWGGGVPVDIREKNAFSVFSLTSTKGRNLPRAQSAMGCH